MPSVTYTVQSAELLLVTCIVKAHFFTIKPNLTYCVLSKGYLN